MSRKNKVFNKNNSNFKFLLLLTYCAKILSSNFRSAADEMELCSATLALKYLQVWLKSWPVIGLMTLILYFDLLEQTLQSRDRNGYSGKERKKEKWYNIEDP